MATTFNLEDKSNLKDAVVWVAGWINGGPVSSKDPTGLLVLHANGTFGAPPQVTNPQAPPATVPGVPFHQVSALTSFQLSVATNGNDRLVFVVAPTSSGTPGPLLAPGFLPNGYAAYPYLGQPAPWVYPPGPFDILEFGMNAGVDVSAVNGFGLNLSFTAMPPGGPTQQFGVRQSMPRRAIREAFKTFVANEVKRLPNAQAFASLLYDKALGGGPTPPMVDGQFFAISDPNDWLTALTDNYQTMADHHLVNYWNNPLIDFFAVGQWLSLNISKGASNIYSGQCALATNPNTLVKSPAYTLTSKNNPNVSYTFYMPTAAEGQRPGLMGAKYVFKQAYDQLTPAGGGGDAGTLQDSIWQALCRGVAYMGASETPVHSGESTATWNNPKYWYLPGYVSDVYAKFLHCSDIAGGDWRTSGQPSLFHGGSAYGFSEDETPDGPYSGPPATVQAEAYAPDGSTVTVTVGPWF
jgi:hypothetical protein